MEHVPLGSPTSSGYSRVPTADIHQQQQLQETLLHEQDRQLEIMSESVGNIGEMSHQIGTELDEQAVMLDEFGAEIENAESKLDASMRKMAKVLHMSNGKSKTFPHGPCSNQLSQQ